MNLALHEANWGGKLRLTYCTQHITVKPLRSFANWFRIIPLPATHLLEKQKDDSLNYILFAFINKR